MRAPWFLTLTMLGACSTSPSSDTEAGSSGSTGTQDTGSSSSSGSSSFSSSTGSLSSSTTTGASTETSSGGATESSTGGPPGPVTAWSPSVLDVGLSCKLISDTGVEDPTANDTHHRANLQGTDLGIPLVIEGALHLFFGDTQGFRVIWPIGEDPDSVARVDAARVRADPQVLCSELEFLLTPDDPSIAAGTDPSILRDFAASTMTPPAGEPLSNYIGQFPAPFENIPGTFEVPTGAIELDGAVYTFWAGRTTFDPRPRMNLSYLARWDPPRVRPDHQIVRPFDALEDGALGGQFIQVLPFLVGTEVYVLGSGDYRFSGVSLMRFPAAEIESGSGAEIFDPEADAWVDVEAGRPPSVSPLFEEDGVGELGGFFLSELELFVVMYQRELHGPEGEVVDNRVVMRSAARPEGPWSEPVTVIDMADPAFTSVHCCGASGCGGEQILDCSVAGLYGIYPLPHPTVVEAGEGAVEADVAFVASTWDPYNVVLFESRVRFEPAR